MKKLFLLFSLILVSLGAAAQFTLDTEAYEKQKREAEEARYKKRIADSIRLVEFEEQKIRSTDIRYRIKWNNMITYRQSMGFVESGYNISYYGYFTSRKTWTYPISLRLSSSKNYNDTFLKDGYKDWSQHLTYLGLTGFRNIGGDFYFSLGGHIPLGWERYRYDYETDSDRRRFHLMTGLSFEERLFYMSPKRVGLVLGLGTYQRLMTSKLYKMDLGLTFEVGIKF